MPYTPQTWADSPATSSPISAARLAHMETGIDDAHEALGELDTETVKKNAGADFAIRGTADTNLLYIDYDQDQVSIGYANADALRKLYVQATDTSTVSTGNRGHTAIEAAIKMAQGSTAANGSGLYGICSVEVAGTYSGRNAAVKGNAYTQVGVGSIDVTHLYGMYARVSQDAGGTIANAVGYYADANDSPGSGAITNSFAFFGERQAAATNNYGFRLHNKSEFLGTGSNELATGLRFYDDFSFDGGGFFGGGSLALAAMAGGAEYVAGTWTNRSTTPSLLLLNGGVLTLFSDTGQTSGAAFPLTTRLKVDTAGRLFQKTPASAPTDGDLMAGSITAYLNEAGNTLTFRVKYADGTTLKSGTVALV